MSISFPLQPPPPFSRTASAQSLPIRAICAIRGLNFPRPSALLLNLPKIPRHPQASVTYYHRGGKSRAGSEGAAALEGVHEGDGIGVFEAGAGGHAE